MVLARNEDLRNVAESLYQLKEEYVRAGFTSAEALELIKVQVSSISSKK